MKPDAITYALVQGGAQWLIATMVAFLPVLWTMTLMLHLAAPLSYARCAGADCAWGLISGGCPIC